MRDKHIKLLKLAQMRGQEKGVNSSNAGSISERPTHTFESLDRKTSLFNRMNSGSENNYSFHKYISSGLKTAGPTPRVSNYKSQSLLNPNLNTKGSDIEEIMLHTKTIDTMKPRVVQLFVFIKNQLMNSDHPINKIAKCFVDNYVDYYSKQILMNAEKFHVKEKNQF